MGDDHDCSDWAPLPPDPRDAEIARLRAKVKRLKIERDERQSDAQAQAHGAAYTLWHALGCPDSDKPLELRAGELASQASSEIMHLRTDLREYRDPAEAKEAAENRRQFARELDDLRATVDVKGSALAAVLEAFCGGPTVRSYAGPEGEALDLARRAVGDWREEPRPYVNCGRWECESRAVAMSRWYFYVQEAHERVGRAERERADALVEVEALREQVACLSGSGPAQAYDRLLAGLAGIVGMAGAAEADVLLEVSRRCAEAEAPLVRLRPGQVAVGDPSLVTPHITDTHAIWGREHALLRVVEHDGQHHAEVFSGGAIRVDVGAHDSRAAAQAAAEDAVTAIARRP